MVAPVNPNLDQILGLVRTLLAAGGPVAGLMTIYGFPENKTALWLGLASIVIPPVVSGVWSWATKTDKAKVAAAGAMPGVSVIVDTSTTSPASAGAQAAAADKAVPGVAPTTESTTKP